MAIISRKHGFIFVKTTKTAGTSIEVELSKRLEPDAIVTPVIPSVSGHEPRNWKRGLFRKQYYNHMPASLIRGFVGRREFESMYTFCVEREPVSKCISHFHMLKNSTFHGGRRAEALTWDEYCARGEFPIDEKKYSEHVGGRVVRLVDTVLCYETLNESLKSVMERVGVAPFDLGTEAKAEYSSKRYVTKDEVTPAQRTAIYRAFASSIAISGLADVYVL